MTKFYFRNNGNVLEKEEIKNPGIKMGYDYKRRTNLNISHASIYNSYTKPFLRVPLIVDYDGATDYLIFGQTLPEPQPPVVHPRRYRQPVLPIAMENAWTCRHNYCQYERKRLIGVPVGIKPEGLPWASGLLPYLPGTIEYKYPIKKSYKTYPEKKKKKKHLPLTPRNYELECIKEEMIHFYKLIMLAGTIIGNKRKEYEAVEAENKEKENQEEENQEKSKKEEEKEERQSKSEDEE